MRLAKFFAIVCACVYLLTGMVWAEDRLSGKIVGGFTSLDLAAGISAEDNSRRKISNMGLGIWENANFGNIFFVTKGYSELLYDPNLGWYREHAEYFFYNSITDKKKLISLDGAIFWYFSDIECVIYSVSRYNMRADHRDLNKKIIKGRYEDSYWIYDLKSKEKKLLLPTDNNAFEGLERIDPSCSYTGTYIYYINKKGELVERNAQNMDEIVKYSLFSFLKDHENSRFFCLSPPSPDRRYIAIQAESELYLIDLERKTMQHIAGKAFGFLGRGVEGPLYWDKTSRYLIFGANFDWLAWVYDHDVYYYDVEKRSTHRIETGDRHNGNFWYSWE